MSNSLPLDELIELAAETSQSPWDWVLAAFPWGKPGTELEHKWPEAWQEQKLKSIGHRLSAGELDAQGAVLEAVASGHGIGKSAFVSWLILWAISTCEDTKGVVTANTENQLKTKTWAELAKWHRLSLFREMFKLTATALFSKDPEHEKTWRIDMVPWSERNTEAFAGLHNQGKRILVVFDEGSAIPDVIWEVTEGALTDENTEIIWFVAGNPTRNRGRFFECFGRGKFAHRWNSHTIDSREVSFTNKRQVARWIEDYGEDSDFVRVRVKGEFPRVDMESFIPYLLAYEATQRSVYVGKGTPVVLGCDVGRGGNLSVIAPRRGWDARSIPWIVYSGRNTRAFASMIVKAAVELEAVAVFVDAGGVGGGVLDSLIEARLGAVGIMFGSAATGTNIESRGEVYLNKRAEMWGEMRAWLRRGAIPEKIQGVEVDLATALSGPQGGLNVKDQIFLESKRDMAEEVKKALDAPDALALTFAEPVLGSTSLAVRAALRSYVAERQFDYDPFDDSRISTAA